MNSINNNLSSLSISTAVRSVKDENSNVCQTYDSSIEEKTSEKAILNGCFEEKQGYTCELNSRNVVLKNSEIKCKWRSPPTRIFRPFLKVRYYSV